MDDAQVDDRTRACLMKLCSRVSRAPTNRYLLVYIMCTPAAIKTITTTTTTTTPDDDDDDYDKLYSERERDRNKISEIDLYLFKASARIGRQVARRDFRCVRACRPPVEILSRRRRRAFPPPPPPSCQVH